MNRSIQRTMIFLSACLMLPRSGAPDEHATSAILYIGDGMGLAHVTAARIYQANARDGALALDAFENVALVRTYSSDAMVTDSAAAGTSLATGKKTKRYHLGVDAEGRRLESILERAKKSGRSVGVVTTTSVSHATPAAFYAHAADRWDELPLVVQLIEEHDLDVVMGGGRVFFLGQDQTEPEYGKPGKRTDGRDMIQRAREVGYRVIQSQKEFDALRADVTGDRDPGKVLGLFNPNLMNYEIDREQDKWGEPSLSAMTELAIDILGRNPKGFFLMVEGGQIDKASHANWGLRAVTETLEFDRAVAKGVRWLRGHPDTLIVATADHETGGLAINGYPALETGGRDLMTAPTNLKDTVKPFGGGPILTFATGPGADRSKVRGIDPASSDYRNPALTFMNSAAHTGIDVIAWAMGPRASAIHGTMNNTEIAPVIMRAMGIGMD